MIGLMKLSVKNIDSFNIAVGDRESEVYFLDSNHERTKNNSGGIHAVTEEDIKKNCLSSILHNKKYRNTMRRLDDLPIEKFDIMLIDVEGREYETIKGAIKKISTKEKNSKHLTSLVTSTLDMLLKVACGKPGTELG